MVWRCDWVIFHVIEVAAGLAVHGIVRLWLGLWLVPVKYAAQLYPASFCKFLCMFPPVDLDGGFSLVVSWCGSAHGSVHCSPCPVPPTGWIPQCSALSAEKPPHQQKWEAAPGRRHVGLSASDARLPRQMDSKTFHNTGFDQQYNIYIHIYILIIATIHGYPL